VLYLKYEVDFSRIVCHTIIVILILYLLTCYVVKYSVCNCKHLLLATTFDKPLSGVRWILNFRNVGETSEQDGRITKSVLFMTHCAKKNHHFCLLRLTRLLDVMLSVPRLWLTFLNHPVYVVIKLSHCCFCVHVCVGRRCYCRRAYTMTATNHDGHKVYHDRHSN